MKNLGPKLEIFIRLASGLFQHGRGDECDLWKLTEFNSDSRFELDAQSHNKQVWGSKTRNTHPIGLQFVPARSRR
ncbi:hypothetical protein Taro_031927 [Colocasia esculenta]|uniref:Uncharacterized protein n=1 Tax=Colocasia esculenta TaxID=4460 RepID=A0A843VXW9_COLES|nr:hypothetical protein [Colocasia esculenta]